MRIPAPRGCEHLAGRIPFAETTSNPDVVRAYATGRFHNKPVRVEPFTMTNMNTAQKLIWDAKLRDLPYGAGNQYSDIVQTRGESGARLKMARNAQRNGGHDCLDPHWRQIARYARRFGVSNCQEYAAVLLEKLEQSNTGHPVGIARVRTGNPDRPHVVPYVGDERDRRYGMKNTVVIPAWEIYPTVSTLAQSKYRFDCHVVELSASPSFPPPPMKPTGEIVPSSEVNQFLADGKWPLVGDALVRKILREEEKTIQDGGQPFLYEQLFATEKPDKVYYCRDGARKSFNAVPAEYWNNRQRTMTIMQRDYRAELDGLPYDPAGRDISVARSWQERLKRRLTE